MGLFSIKLQDPDFYASANEDSIIEINKDEKTIAIEGLSKVFRYDHTIIEETLLDAGGVLPLYGEFGTSVFRKITAPPLKHGKKRKADSQGYSAHDGQTESGMLEW
jgi:homoaconitate hydratase